MFLDEKKLVSCSFFDRMFEFRQGERERSSIYVSYLDHLKKRTGLILTLEQ